MLLLSIVTVLLSLYFAYILIVNQRLASRNFSYVNNDKTQYQKFTFQPRKVVLVKGMQDCVILMSDSIRLELHRGDVGAFRSVDDGDTLRFVFSAAATNRAYLYLPNGLSLVADSSYLEMRGSLDFNRLPEYDLKLRSSTLLASGHNTHAFVGKLAVNASGNSRLRIARYFHVNELALVNVHDATFAQGWQIGNLTTAFDDGTDIVMSKYRDSVAIHARQY